MSWSTYTDENGRPAVRGSDGGIIIADEEHGLGARITLERDATWSSFSITCGIYGSMLHTRYFGHLDEAKSAYQAMKPALDEILQSIPSRDDPDLDAKLENVSDAMSRFVDRFP